MARNEKRGKLDRPNRPTASIPPSGPKDDAEERPPKDEELRQHRLDRARIREMRKEESED